MDLIEFPEEILQPHVKQVTFGNDSPIHSSTNETRRTDFKNRRIGSKRLNSVTDCSKDKFIFNVRK